MKLINSNELELDITLNYDDWCRNPRDTAKNFINRVIEQPYYVLVEWPESQQFMEEEWFEEEAILALGSEEITGSSAYFIPVKYML